MDLEEFAESLSDEWHHVLVTIENFNCGFIKLYVDGALVSSGANTKYGDLVGGDLQIGSQGGGTPSYFERYVDDVRIWHSALSAGQVTTVFGSSDALYAATPSNIVKYGDDIFDRRISKRVNLNAQADTDIIDTNEGTQQYVYDGDDIVLAFDKGAALTNRYLHGPAVDQILADEQYGASGSHDDPATRRASSTGRSPTTSAASGNSSPATARKPNGSTTTASAK